MRFSVVMPVLNEEESLEKSLKSLKSQTFKDFELIVVDNGSTDRSPEIAKNYADKLIFERKRGVIKAIKRGFEIACGEILLCADADTVYPPDYLERLDRIFSNEKIVAVYGPFAFIEKSRLFNLGAVIIYAIFNALSRMVAGLPLSGAANFAFRRWAYEESGGYDFGNLASQDFRLARKLKRYGKVRYVPTLVVRTSYRRFEKKGLGKGLKEAFRYWLDVALKIDKIEYSVYYDEDYYRNKRNN